MLAWAVAITRHAALRTRNFLSISKPMKTPLATPLALAWTYSNKRGWHSVTRPLFDVVSHAPISLTCIDFSLANGGHATTRPSCAEAWAANGPCWGDDGSAPDRSR